MTLKEVLTMKDSELEAYNSRQYTACDCWYFFWKLLEKGYEESEVKLFPFFVGSR